MLRSFDLKIIVSQATSI